MTRLTYNPQFFDAADPETARRIILTREGDLDTAERWERETPYLTDLISDRLALKPGMLVVDFGCGIGRLSKALIERSGCLVLGVDLSQDMRGFAPTYVGSPNFSVVSPEMFARMVDGGLRADAAISVWVLQHCLDPVAEIDRLARGLAPGGRLLAVNNVNRAVPTVEKRWGDDGIDIRAALGERLKPCQEGGLDPAAVGQLLAIGAYWGLYATEA
jgi:SAM-dependent methyltransferase